MSAMRGPWVVKLRRVGHSLVVTIPKELEADGYVAGAKVYTTLNQGTIWLTLTGSTPPPSMPS